MRVCDQCVIESLAQDLFITYKMPFIIEQWKMAIRHRAHFESFINRMIILQKVYILENHNFILYIYSWAQIIGGRIIVVPANRNSQLNAKCGRVQCDMRPENGG